MTQPDNKTDSSSMPMVEKFKTMAETVQAVVYEVDGISEVFSEAVRITTRQGGKTVAAMGFSDEMLESLEAICKEQNLELLRPPLRERLGKIHTSITPADSAIAETGTLVLDSSSEDKRIATMLCETHVACIAKNKIHPDAMSMEKSLDERMKNPPAYQAFITGASRTADIERVLTIGVHGPGELHIFITEDNGS